MDNKREFLIAGALLTVVLLLAGVAAALAGPEGGAPAGRAAQTKDMVFWLHWDPTSPTVNGKATQLTFNTTQYWTKTNYTIDGDKNLQMDFYLIPALAGDLTVNGTVVLGIWGNYSGSNNNFQLQAIIYERNVTGNENWTSSTYSNAYAPASAPQFYTFSFTNFLHTFAAGSTIHLNIQVTGGSGIYKAIYVDTATNNSRIIFPCQDYMAVTGLNACDWTGTPQGGFSSTMSNTTIIFRSTLTDPFGGYDIRWSNLTLTGPDQSVIINNQTMTKVAGTPVSFTNSYELSWNFSGRPPGRYNITAWAVDNNGYYYYYYFMNYNYGYYMLTNTSFFFIGSPRYVNVMALDSTGLPLTDAEVAATVLDTIVDRNLTDLAGLTNLTLQSGAYNMRVFWKGVMVADEPVNITDNISDADPLVIYCAVFYPTFATVDSRGAALVDAAVYVHYPNGTASILPYRTNLTGEFSVDQASRGLYELSVVWGGLEVNRTIILVNGNVTYTLACDVFYLKVRLVDPHLQPVPNARVVINDNSTGIVADSRMTDQDGTVEFRLPRHFYDMTAYWNEAVVNTTYHVRVYADGQVELVCGIYYFTVLAVDSHDLPITDAQGVVSFSSSG